ncbi:MAG: hypothetical protein KF735_16365, partial [Chelatococcus sp.]|uniref:hypothetical protein n=1 Tax=Chelatococcus sp. TaxID=1953771 RepID=UPI0025B8C6E5
IQARRLSKKIGAQVANDGKIGLLLCNFGDDSLNIAVDRETATTLMQILSTLVSRMAQLETSDSNVRFAMPAEKWAFELPPGANHAVLSFMLQEGAYQSFRVPLHALRPMSQTLGWMAEQAEGVPETIEFREGL